MIVVAVFFYFKTTDRIIIDCYSEKMSGHDWSVMTKSVQNFILIPMAFCVNACSTAFLQANV